MASTRIKTQYIFAPITRVNEEERTVTGYCFVNPSVRGDTYSVSRKAMEEATPEYLRWGAIRAMHQPIAAGTAEAIVWDENGAMLRAKIVDDQEWRKVKAGVYKGFSIGVRPELVRGNSVEKLTWVENSLVDRPKDPDAVFTVARAEGFDPGEEFECEVEEPATFDELLSLDKENAIRKAFGAPPLERATIAEDGVSNADPDEEGYRPVKASDCTITREGDLYVLNGPDGALIGKFKTEAEARARAAEVQDAMKDGDGGKEDATDQKGTTLVLPTDRVEEPAIAEGEELDLVRSEDGACWNLIRQSNGEIVHQAESIEAAGAWIKEALARAVTVATPSLPVRENLEGKSPKESRADGDTDDEGAKPGVCPTCGQSVERDDETHGADRDGAPGKKWAPTQKTEAASQSVYHAPRADEAEVERTEEAAEPEVSTPPDSTLTIARLETDNAALILRAETAETELARVQTAKEGLTRDLATAKEQITRLEAMPVAQQPLRFAHAVTREFFANAKLDHDGESARIATRMTEITAMAPTSDLGEQATRAQEYQILKMALAARG
jgi:hypothetical protein